MGGKQQKKSRKLEEVETIGESLPHSEATESFIENVKANAEQTIAAADATPEPKKTWTCPKCQRVFKSEGFYIVHIRDCTGPKPKREKLTDEQKAEKRKTYLGKYLAVYTPISFRIKNDSAERTMLDARLVEIRKTTPDAVYTHAVRAILAEEVKRQQKRATKDA